MPLAFSLLDRSSGPFSFCGKKRMGGWKAPLLEGERSAPSGRKDKLGRAKRGIKKRPPALAKAVRLRRGSLRAALRQKEMRPRAAEKNPRRTASGVVERAKGVEPSYQAWEACILPMNYARGNEFIIPQIFDFSRAFLHDGEKSFRQGAAKRDSGGAGPPLSGRLGFIPFSRSLRRPDGRFAGDWCRRRCGDGSPPDGA